MAGLWFEILGSIIDPVSNNKVTVQSPDNGTILGLGDNQFVAPGYAIYRLGYTKSEEQLQRKAVQQKRSEAEEKIQKGKDELQESVK